MVLSKQKRNIEEQFYYVAFRGGRRGHRTQASQRAQERLEDSPPPARAEWLRSWQRLFSFKNFEQNNLSLSLSLHLFSCAPIDVAAFSRWELHPLAHSLPHSLIHSLLRPVHQMSHLHIHSCFWHVFGSFISAAHLNYWSLRWAELSWASVRMLCIVGDLLSKLSWR